MSVVKRRIAVGVGVVLLGVALAFDYVIYDVSNSMAQRYDTMEPTSFFPSFGLLTAVVVAAVAGAVQLWTRREAANEPGD